MNSIKRKPSVPGTLITPDDAVEAASLLTMRALSVDGAQGKLAARLYVPARAEVDNDLIVFFPPGGFVTCALDDLDALLRLLTVHTGCRVLASTYTVASQRPFPAAVEDALAVLKWAVKERIKLKWNGKRLITAGIEAGGNLAAVSALMARDRGGPALAAQLLIMPMLDPGLTSCSMRAMSEDAGVTQTANACAAGYRGYLPNAADRNHPYASPIQSSRTKGLPPTLILSADDDPLRDEAEQYGAKLIAAGIKTLVRRLPPIPLEQADARCSCVRKANALNEITAFVSGLQSSTPNS
jgi:acetyl esterase/lipase